MGGNIPREHIALENWDLFLQLITKAVCFFYCVMSWIPGKEIFPSEWILDELPA